MSWIIILFLIGLGLLLYEIFLIPGTSFIGMLGGIASIFAIILVFRKYGLLSGYISLFITVSVVFILVIVGSKNKVWQRVANQSIFSAKANTIEQDEIKPGLIGYAVSDIKTVGTANFNDTNYSVQSEIDNISKGTVIEVIKVNVDKIIVKPHINNA